MIGNGYWSTGIIVTYDYSGGGRYGWRAVVDFYDDGFCEDDIDTGTISTEGTLHSRYAVRDGESPGSGLAAVIDAVRFDAGRLGIRFGKAGRACLYYRGDGLDKDYPPPPGWKELLAAQEQRLGWNDPSAATAGEETS